MATTDANLMQTAVNAATTLASAYVNAGLVSTIEEAKSAFDSERTSIFELLKAVPNAEAPRSGGSYGGQRRSGGGGGSVTAADARMVVLKFGKFGPADRVDGTRFEGFTLGELEAMSAEEAEKYKPGNGPGVKYLEWLSKNEQNPFIAKRAKAILDDRKASSAEAA